MPVGKGAGGNPFGAESEQPPAQAAKNADDDKPLPDRLVSKTWAVRKTAFEELHGIISKYDRGTSNDVMNEHASKWPKYLAEPNPGALEKVLDCFNMFIDRGDPALLASMQDKIYEPIMDKCLGAPKPNLKAKSLECMLLLFEVSENFGDETIDAFKAVLKSKKPKIAFAAIQLLAALMTAFGIKKFSPAKFNDQIKTAANSSDPKTRTEAMNCYKAIFLWVGEAGASAFIEPLKEAQKVQLKKDFETLKDQKDFKRKTRTEQEEAKAAALDDAINAAVEEEKKEEVIDVFDISAPQEILSKFGPDWAATTLAIKKWNEKKEVLDAVNAAADVPKLAQGDYSGLFEVLKKLAADPHVAVAQHAIKAIGNLAKGLREAFKEHAIAAVPVCFAKLKEKRAVDDILQSLENLLMCCEIADIAENFKKIKTEKTPGIKLNMVVYMERAIRVTYIDQLEEVVDQLAPLAVFASEDKDATTREQGLTTLGVLLARVPNTMEKYVSGLIEAKKSKINATKETVKITKYDKSEKKAKAAAAAAAKKKPAAKPASTKKAAAMDVDMKDDSLPGDNVLMEVAPKKPTRAPPNIGKKPVKKVADDDDGGAPEPPKRGGPPARLAAKASGAAAGSGVTKVIKADDIQEEDIGSGMGKETAIEKVNEFYDAAIVAKFEEAKWQDKVQGFTDLKAAIEQLQPDKTMVEATCKFIKARMKDWKESNINLMKESINTLITLTKSCEDVPKRALACYAPFLCDKIGDIKMQALVKEAYVNSAEFCTAKFVCVQVVKKGLTAKAPNNIKETCNLLGQLIDDFGAGRVAPKECIDFGIFSANHANKGVRDASMAMLATLYKQLGEKINKFLDGVKPSTMQLIQAEFDKVTVYEKGEFQSTRQVRGEAAEVEASGGGGGGGGAEPDALAALESALPRADISKQLNAKLIKMFTESDWKLKVKGCETVQGILKEAGMRIQPDGIGELMEQLKVNFKASNKAVLKQVILLMGVMAEAVGQPIMTYNKKCFKPLLAFLGDKAALMRADVIATANKWCEAIGPEHVIQNMCTYLTDGNPEMRTECLKWMCAHKDAIAKCEHQPMVKPLIMCLTDKKGEIRVMTDEMIVAMMGQTGFSPFAEGIRDLKPALQQTVRPLLEKAKAKMIAANPGSAPAEPEEDSKPSGPTKKITVTRKTAVAGPTKKTDLSQSVQPSRATVSRKTDVKSMAASMPPAPQDDDEFTISPGNKERRAAIDNKQRWVPDDIKPQHIFGQDFAKEMWSNDFKKHVKAIEKILPLIDSQPMDLMECVDVIFKWTAIKLAESSNTTFQSAIYDFYTKLFEFLIEQNYLFWDHEADVVIPLLCERSGNNNQVLKGKVKALIKMCFEMHDHKKTLLMIVKHGAMNKNLKSAGESLDEIATFLRSHNSVPFGEQHIKTIAKLVDSKDASVRENSLQVLSEIYKVLDEDIWRVMGQLPLKVKGLLETRFKKVKGGLGSSTSNTNIGLGRSTATSKAAASPKKQEVLTRSFNPGLKGQTPRDQNLKFNPKQDSAQKDKSPARQGGLTRSFRPGTASQSNLQRSFGGGQKASFGQRPQTAMNQDDNRATLPPPTTGNTFGGRQSSANRKTAAMDFHPPQNEMHFMDDDEDLRQQIQEMEGPKKEALDPETQRQVDDIMKFISNLKYSSDLNKRVESLIALNDIIQAVQKHEKSMQHTANDLISAFTHVLNDIFERPRQDTPLRFAKYFVTIVNKTCQCSTVMKVVREQELYELNEQLLTRLLIDNLDKLGDEKEGEFILKNLNGSMLRCLENCNKTSIFCVLFNLLRRYKDNAVQPKLPGLIIKCLLKLSKILEKVINDLEIERVLLVIHLYLISINHEQKTSNDEMGIRIVKTLVHEMVKVKRHSVLDSYKVVEAHEVEDKHLQRWIKIILNTMGPPESPSPSAGGDSSSNSSESEINSIIAQLKNNEQFQAAIPKLHNFLTKNPHLSLDYYMRDLSAYFKSMIKSNLESYRNQLSDSGSTPNNKLPISQPPVSNPQDRPSFKANSSSSNLGLQSQNSESKRFGFRSTQANASSAATGFNDAAQNATNMRATQQPMSGRTGNAPGSGADSVTSTDRINSYQSKLSSMREKFQQRKTLGTAEPPNKSQSQAAGSGGQSATKNFNASFSAMNTSLQQRWKAVQTKGKPNESGQSAMSNTMVPNATGNRFSTEVGQPKPTLSTSGAMNTSQGANAGSGEGASNQELNKRLLELRSKLATLRK